MPIIKRKSCVNFGPSHACKRKTDVRKIESISFLIAFGLSQQLQMNRAHISIYARTLDSWSRLQSVWSNVFLLIFNCSVFTCTAVAPHLREIKHANYANESESRLGVNHYKSINFDLVPNNGNSGKNCIAMSFRREICPKSSIKWPHKDILSADPGHLINGSIKRHKRIKWI